MDPGVSENKTAYPLRRSKRQSSGNATAKALTFEPTPRGPLKRTRKGLKNQASAPDVNGSGDAESDSGDEGKSPSKKNREETGTPGDENEMDVEESDGDLEKQADHDMDIIQDSSHVTRQPTTGQGDDQNVNLHPRVMLGECHRSPIAVNEDADWMKTNRVKPSTKEHVAPTKSATQIRPPANRQNVLVTSMADYKKTMEAKANSAGIPTVKHHVPLVHPASDKCYTTRKRVNDIPTQRLTAPHQRKGMKKTAVPKKSSGYSCRGFMWGLWHLVLLVLFSSVLIFLAYTIIPALKKTLDGGTRAATTVDPERFADHLSLLETQFPSQQPELWRRSKIHLERHLNSAHPTQPVSLIITAGRAAERTLRCLAQRLAASFSSALNASVLHIDGASKAGLDSDEVKLDIDSQLRAAFEGNKSAAIIHRFEELPPGSTLIFYRYCDHENAAYKQAFLLFTVLLPQEEVMGDQSLKDLEEMVHDYVKVKLVDSSNKAGFNEMDIDKYGGLWSRISHLVLPVVSEKEVEQKGC